MEQKVHTQNRKKPGGNPPGGYSLMVSGIVHGFLPLFQPLAKAPQAGQRHHK
jgi:hypothetical protein